MLEMCRNSRPFASEFGPVAKVREKERGYQVNNHRAGSSNPNFAALFHRTCS